MNKIIYVSDYFLSDIIGGGELNDHELCSLLIENGATINKVRSNLLNLEFLKNNKDSFFIISNFVNLNTDMIKFISSNLRYIIYEHDHKYLRSRNPAIYKNYLAPKTEIINFDFYKNAVSVFCQSSFHKKIIYKNLNIENLHNVSGNLWSEDSINKMRKMNKQKKNDRFSILKSNTKHKNTWETVSYCKNKQYDYDLISSSDYGHFLFLLGSNSKFIFLPKTPETLSRVCVEARMMGVTTVVNKNVGASYEPWFKSKGDELIDTIVGKRKQITEKVLELANGY